MPEGLKTIVRCRPFSTEEKNRSPTKILKFNGNQIILSNLTSGSVKEHTFSFDHCYPGETKTDDIYKEVVEPLVGQALEGFDVGVIAFGQKSSGKSFTISGTHEEAGLITAVSLALFNVVKDAVNYKEYFISVSYLEDTEDGCIFDLINPSGHNLKLRNHPQLGLYVDDLAEVQVLSSDDIIRFCEQGNRIRTLASSNINDVRRSNTIFTIAIEQKSLTGNSKSLRSRFSFVTLINSEHTSKADDAPYIAKSLNCLQSVVASLSTNTDHVPYRDSNLTRLLENHLGGSAYLSAIGHISPNERDYTETVAILNFMMLLKNIENKPKKTEIDTSSALKSLRDEISNLRAVISSGTNTILDMPGVDDVKRMEELIKDLEFLKLQTWEEKQRISAIFLKERRHHLSNKGILDTVQENKRTVDKDINASLIQLNKDKEQMMLEYKEKRKVVDSLKEKLQEKITEYTKLTEQGKGDSEEGNNIISEIQVMKDTLKDENENLKKIKSALKENQEKQKLEKEEAKSTATALKGNFELRFKLESENREKNEKENQLNLADEVDRIKMETEQEKAEIKLKKAQGRTCTIDDLIKLEVELVELKGEKTVMATKLRAMEEEKKQLNKDLNELFKRQKEELEVQQLQHLQTFRVYRETFEEQKTALEQRYRTLLEDSIQDAVYLSTTTQELLDENKQLKQEVAEMKDKLSASNGRPASGE